MHRSEQIFRVIMVGIISRVLALHVFTYNSAHSANNQRTALSIQKRIDNMCVLFSSKIIF